MQALDAKRGVGLLPHHHRDAIDVAARSSIREGVPAMHSRRFGMERSWRRSARMATIPQGLGSGSRGLSGRPAHGAWCRSAAAAAAGAAGGQGGTGGRARTRAAAAAAEAPLRTASSASSPCSSSSSTSSSNSLPASSPSSPFWGSSKLSWGWRRPQPSRTTTITPRASGSSNPNTNNSSSSSSSGNTGNTLNSGSGEFPTDPFKQAYDDRMPPGLVAGRNMVNTRTGPADVRNADSSSDEDDPHHIARAAAVVSSAAASGGGGGGSGGGGAAAGAASEAAAAQLAAAAVAVAAAQLAAPPPRASPARLLGRVAGLLRSHFLPVLLLYAVKDAAAFCLHRVVQRLTNHAAEVLLGAPTSTAGNPWWLFLDAGFMRAHPGYEILVGLFFLVSLPLSIALNTIAFTTASLICCPPELRPPEARAALEAAAAARAAAAAAAEEAAKAGKGGSAAAAAAAGSAPLEESADALADLGIGVVRTAPSPATPHSPTPASSSSPSASPSPSASSPAAASSPAPSTSASPTPAPAAAADGAAAGAAAARAADGSSTSSSSSSSSSTSAAGEAGSSTSSSSSSGSSSSASSEDGGGGLGAALAAAARDIGALLPAVGAMLRRVWWVDMNINLRALPLQGLCLLVLPAFWALPRLMRIQASLPVAVLEGRAGTEALERSGRLMVASVGAYGWPFAALLGLGRLLEYVQNVALVLVPPRWWREVVEVPLAMAGAFLLLKAAVHRLQDLLPLAAYLELSQQEKQAAAEAAAEAGVGMAAATAAAGAAAAAAATSAAATPPPPPQQQQPAGKPATASD